MRLGILGGSFNPLHNGHIAIAKQIKAEYSLDRVLFMVANDPPHKQIAAGVSANARFEMTRLALQGEDGLEVSDLELRIAGKSYTINTVRELRAQHPEAQIRCIVGADMLLNLPEWHQHRQLLAECGFIGVNRPGYDMVESAAEAMRAEYGADIWLTSFSGPELSSTGLRESVRNGASIRGQVPEAVAEYIYEHGLYFPEALERIRVKLKETLKPKRYSHVVGTVRMAVDLAEAYGIDPDKARLAALLHDCAKVAPEEQLRLAEALGVDVSEYLPAFRGVIHGPVGAALAQRDYGVADVEVLDAIRYHTLCRVGMTPLEKLTYLADKIEYTREDYDGLEALREAAWQGLDEGVLACMERSLHYITEGKGAALHPAVLEAMEDIQAHMEGR